jgi:ribonuclease VapC
MAPIQSASLLVVDSWPVMEWFLDREPAASRFQELLQEAMRGERRLLISVVNLGEVFYCVAKLSSVSTAERVVETLARLKIETASVDDDLVWQAARLKATFPIAYGDAFAAALAIRESVPLLTGDPEFRLLEAAKLLQMEWVQTTGG